MKLKRKKCSACKQILPIKFFYREKGKNYFKSRCKDCSRKFHKIWVKNNPEKVKNSRQKFRKNNPEKHIASSKKWAKANTARVKKNYKIWAKKNVKKLKNYSQQYYKKHSKKIIAAAKIWKKNNPKKVLANTRKRQAFLLKRTPKWITKEHLKEIKQIYINCPKGYCVDHLYPLRGKEVSGLHVPWNLWYLNENRNIKKFNKMPSEDLIKEADIQINQRKIK